MQHAVKVLHETAESYTIGGYAVIWGGRDIAGETFVKGVTDFWDDYTAVRPPLLYDHGHDPVIGREPLGRIVTKSADDTGLWVEAQIDKSKKYAQQVMELIRKGIVGMSSGAVSHLVEIANGQIKAWPLAEVSVTVSPMDPRQVGQVQALRSSAAAEMEQPPAEPDPLAQLVEVQELLAELYAQLADVFGDAGATPEAEPVRP